MRLNDLPLPVAGQQLVSAMYEEAEWFEQEAEQAWTANKEARKRRRAEAMRRQAQKMAALATTPSYQRS